MKKVLLLFAAFLAVSQSAFADVFFYTYQGQTLLYEIEYGSAHVSRKLHTASGWHNSSISGDLVIPSSVLKNDTTYLVTSIDEFAFSGSSGLTSVIIGNSVTSIGERAFQNCSNLTSVTIGHSVTEIGDYAFLGCSGLTTVAFNASNCISVGGAFYYAFANCTNITDFTIGNNVTRIPNYLCYNKSGLTSVTIPNSVTRIGLSAFENCTGLTSVTIPNSVAYIGNNAYKGCSGLTTIVFNADSCTFAGVYNQRVFHDCTNITNFNIGSNVKVIPDYLCDGLSGLTSVTIPNFVTSIGRAAFAQSGLTSITIPNSVTSIGRAAFANCSSLISANIGNAVTSIDTSVFENCNGMTTITIPNSVTFIGKKAFSGCSGLTSVIIPNSVISIGDEAFYSCTSLASVTMGSGVTTIGDAAFIGCNNLTSVIFNADSCISAGHFLNFENSIFPSTSLTNIIFGNNVRHIPSFVCQNCSSLTSVTIGSSVTSIGAYAFSGCNGLTSVNIPDGVISIADKAFECSDLDTVYMMPITPPSIGSYAFGNNASIVFILSGCSYNNYYNSNVWNSYRNALRNPIIDINVNVLSSNSTNGTAYVVLGPDNRIVRCDSTVILQATPNTGYHFDHWSTGSTANPVTITLMGDSTITAYFEATILQYTITAASANPVMGTVTGGGTYNGGATATLTATPNPGYHFVQWQDGNTQNPRTITVTGDATYTATFAPDAAPATVTATISQIAATSAYAEIVMGQQTSYFYLIYAPQSVFTQNGLTTDEAIISYVNQHYGSSDRNYSNVSGYMNDLTPNTTYQLVVVPYNSNGEVGMVCWEQFTTLNETDPATVTATISEVTATSAYAEIVMGQQTSYFYLIYAPQSIFTQNGLTTDEAIINYVNQNYGSSDRNYNNVSGYMNDLTPNTTYMLVVVPYNSDNEVGTVCKKQFTTLNNNGIEDVGEEEYAISSQGGRLTVSGAEGNMVNVYSLDGRCIYSASAKGTTVIDIPASGTYLLKIGHHPARKVVVIR